MCLIPNPNEILDASGDPKLITKSGLNFSIFFESLLILSILASSLVFLLPPPCFPTNMRSK